MAPKLEHVFRMRGYMDRTSLDLGPIKNGPHRNITALTGGFVEGVQGSRGEGLSVKLGQGGSDWILFDPATNICHLDVRTHGQTEAGQSLFIYYHGYLELDTHAATFMKWSPEAKSTTAGQHNWFSAPRIETSRKSSGKRNAWTPLQKQPQSNPFGRSGIQMGRDHHVCGPGTLVCWGWGPGCRVRHLCRIKLIKTCPLPPNPGCGPNNIRGRWH